MTADIIAYAKAAEERAEKANQTVENLCLPTTDPEHRRWLMSIPARPDHDPDLVIGASLSDVTTLARMVVRMAETLEAYALDEDKELGKLAYVTLFNLTAELKGAEHAEGR